MDLAELDVDGLFGLDAVAEALTPIGKRPFLAVSFPLPDAFGC